MKKLEEQLAESEWERERLKRRLQEKEEARMAEEERAERYSKSCEFYMDYSKSVTANLHLNKASFLEAGVFRKKKKKTNLELNQKRVRQRVKNQPRMNVSQKREAIRMKPNQRMETMSMRRNWKEKKPKRTSPLGMEAL